MSAPLHCCTAEAWLDFSNSWCLLSGNDLGARVKRDQLHWLLYKQLASPLICFLFYVMIALLAKPMLWSVWGSPSLVACSHSAQHPSHVDGMHPWWTLVYHFFIIQATCIWLLLMCHSTKTLLYLSFWIIQLIRACTEIGDPLVLVLRGLLLSHHQMHSSGYWSTSCARLTSIAMLQSIFYWILPWW